MSRGVYQKMGFLWEDTFCGKLQRPFSHSKHRRPEVGRSAVLGRCPVLTSDWKRLHSTGQVPETPLHAQRVLSQGVGDRALPPQSIKATNFAPFRLSA